MEIADAQPPPPYHPSRCTMAPLLAVVASPVSSWEEKDGVGAHLLIPPDRRAQPRSALLTGVEGRGVINFFFQLVHFRTAAYLFFSFYSGPPVLAIVVRSLEEGGRSNSV